MTFAVVVGALPGATPAVFIVWVLGAAARSGIKECAARRRRRSEECPIMTAAHPQLPEPDYSVLPPRRAQVRLAEPQLRAIFGLAPDESLVSVRYDTRRGGVTAIVESPRLRPVGFFMGQAGDGEPLFQPTWDCDPPYITLPISAHYEPQPDRPS